jgi:hypothetical protein
MNAENRLFGEVLRQTDALLIPDPGKIVRAKERARRLAEALDRSDAAMFRVVRCHDHGSTSRGTCIDGFQDLDLLVELDPATLRTGSGSERTPSDTISRMARALEARRRGPVSLGLVKIRAQDHSVGVEYAGQEGFRVDLVPAIDAGAGRLKIPERGSGRWIVTSPGETKQRVERAIRRSPEVISAIRLLKGWKRARGRNAPIPSFGVETMVVDAALAGSAALEGLVRDFFHTIAGSDARMRLVLGGTSARGCPSDPRGSGVDGKFDG